MPTAGPRWDEPRKNQHQRAPCTGSGTARAHHSCSPIRTHRPPEDPPPTSRASSRQEARQAPAPSSAGVSSRPGPPPCARFQACASRTALYCCTRASTCSAHARADGWVYTRACARISTSLGQGHDWHARATRGRRLSPELREPVLTRLGHVRLCRLACLSLAALALLA